MAQATKKDEVKMPDVSCLTRQQKEKIEETFENNEICHDALEKVQSDAETGNVVWFIGTFLLGGLLGVVATSQLHH